ncbi:kinase-like domain-containing protein [Halteromyces radiatus]|uniref:kinase-like domain-containing protein n=1 Tax=Halteromyces radiatus TaxID=101107 RepID=UPI00221F13B8|nr:kinase-like domain-containing protein [Halteromyces radiatus]KAI8078831.1 kinase-like domain-containing protein [Halteromyces radiatus]
MDEQELDSIYKQTLSDELVYMTKSAIQEYISTYPHAFALDVLYPHQPREELSVLMAKMTQLYQDITQHYMNNQVYFDHTWHWTLLWRQQLSIKHLAEQHGKDKVIMAIHPRARTAVRHMFEQDLDGYMQWFPWNWFSNMIFIGAGGFSAVYSCDMNPTFEILQTTKMALKIVDDKVLNEISVESKVFAPLLFHGLTVCESTGDLMMVMKLSNDGNLEDHMQLLPLGDLDLKTITGTILRLAANLADLHNAGLCHHNVHPRNIICTDSDYFLVDYRYSTVAQESSSVMALTKAVYGRLPYVAPEVRRGQYSQKSDIYSLGIIIWQLVSKVIFPSPDVLLEGHNYKNNHDDDGDDDDDRKKEQRRWRRPESHVYRIDPVPGVPSWYTNLYVACLEPLPQHRPTAQEICQALHPIHEQLDYSVPLPRSVTEYIVARRAEVADFLRTYAKLKGLVSVSASRLFAQNSLPSTLSFILLPYNKLPFSAIWNPL